MNLVWSTNLNAFFICNSSNDLDTNFSDFGKIWLVDTNVSQNFDDPLAYTDTSILSENINSMYLPYKKQYTNTKK